VAAPTRLRRRRGLSLVAALAVTVPICLSAAAAEAVSGQAVPAGSQAPALARAVAGARTTAARIAAIDHIMAVFHVDMINPANGAVVAPGAARPLKDAYLCNSSPRIESGKLARLASGRA
jgi:hypothetical protein